MQAKSAEVTGFLERDLPPQVKAPLERELRKIDAAEDEHGKVKESNWRVSVPAAEDVDRLIFEGEAVH